MGKYNFGHLSYYYLCLKLTLLTQSFSYILYVGSRVIKTHESEIMSLNTTYCITCS